MHKCLHLAQVCSHIPAHLKQFCKPQIQSRSHKSTEWWHFWKPGPTHAWWPGPLPYCRLGNLGVLVPSGSGQSAFVTEVTAGNRSVIWIFSSFRAVHGIIASLAPSKRSHSIIYDHEEVSLQRTWNAKCSSTHLTEISRKGNNFQAERTFFPKQNLKFPK